MRQPAHIVLAPWHAASIGVRVACEAVSALLWPLTPDHRMTVLITLLAHHIGGVAKTDDQIDAVIDMLRMQMRRTLRDAPPLQSGG